MFSSFFAFHFIVSLEFLNSNFYCLRTNTDLFLAKLAMHAGEVLLGAINKKFELRWEGVW